MDAYFKYDERCNLRRSIEDMEDVVNDLKDQLHDVESDLYFEKNGKNRKNRIDQLIANIDCLDRYIQSLEKLNEEFWEEIR